MSFTEVLVIYNDNCADGFCSAWCAHQYYLEAVERGEVEITFYGANHGEDPPMDLVKKAHKTYILDFSYSRDAIIEISKYTDLKVLDHHIKAIKELNNLEFCEFDITKSGAGMAWDHFFPEAVRPWFVDYIETRDIWEWKWPNAKEILAYLDTVPRSFEAYDKILDGHLTLSECLEKGKAIRNYVESILKETIDLCLRYITFQAPDGKIYKNVPIINCIPDQVSEIVNHISTGHDFGLGYFRRKDGKYQYGVRVPAESSFDGNAFANLYGGGGHVKASGFTLDRELTEIKYTERGRKC